MKRLRTTTVGNLEKNAFLIKRFLSTCYNETNGARSSIYSHQINSIVLPRIRETPKYRTSNDIKRLSIDGKLKIKSNQTFREAKPNPNDHIYVAMSSGVDSSTVAALMAKAYPGRVSGIYMCNWTSSSKCTESEWNDVQKVCRHIGIPAHRVNFEKDYWTQVFEPMINMYSKGLTPNPDVNCNRSIKFGSLLEYIQDKQGSNTNWKLATGHYARMVYNEHLKSYHLLRSLDSKKDQSYYLSSIIPSALKHIMFPLGQLTKPQVREIAISLDLPTAFKPDSQGLCFVSQNQRQFRDFLAEYINPNDGEIITEEGEVVGHHKGLWSATIGQRSSVSMPQGDAKYRGVWYVSDKNVVKNQLVIVSGRDNPSLYRKKVICEDFRILDKSVDLGNVGSIQAQYRSLQTAEPLKAIKCEPIRSESEQSELISESNAGPDTGSDSRCKLQVEFLEPRRAVAPGQYLVLYDGDRVIGSGIIDRVSN